MPGFVYSITFEGVHEVRKADYLLEA
jgi:hypothetical protein